MKKLKNTFWISIITALLIFSGGGIIAQVPATYYNSAIGLTGSALKQELHDITTSEHSPVSYDYLWTSFQSTDVDNYYESDGTVMDMYSENPSAADPYNFNYTGDQCGTYVAEGGCYNREHTFPKAWWGGAESGDKYTDLNQVIPSDGYVNNRRANYPLGEVGTASWTSNNGSKVGSSSYSGVSGTVFEPIDEFKGDLARMLFYMATRYKDEILGWVSANSGSGIEVVFQASGDFQPDYLNMLYEWHLADPVSQKEIDRNDEVYDDQGNANPYINHPEWVCEVFIGSCTATPIITSSNNTISDLIYVVDLGPSTPSSFDVSGSNLTGTTVTVTAPTNYEISLTESGTYATNLNISYTAPTLNSTPIYVRLKAGLPIGVYTSETVTLSDNGAKGPSTTVNLNGEVKAPATTTCEDFESYTTSNSYTGGTYGDWVLVNGRVFTDNPHGGTNSVTFDDDAGASLTNQGSDGNGIDGGVGTVTVWYRHWDADGKSVKFQMQYNQGGGGWTNFGPEIDATSTTYSQYSFDLNLSGDDILLKLNSTAYSERLILDDFCYTNYSASGAEVDWCNVQSPASGSIKCSGDFNVYAQVYEDGVTNAAGQGADIDCWIGYSTVDNDPEANPGDWTWVVASYNTDSGNNDEYMANIGASLTEGTYYYCSRFQLSGGTYKYGGYNVGGGGFWDGTSNVSGTLTVDGTPGWYNLQWPENGTVTLGAGFDVYAQIFVDGVTNAAGQGSGISAWIGYSTVDNDPTNPANSGDWTWVVANYSSDQGNNDEYSVDLETAIGSAGTYYYASRFQMGSCDYFYGGYNGGAWSNTYASGVGNKSGQLVINAPPADVTLANNGTQIAVADVPQGTSKHTLHTFQLTVADAATELSQVDFTSAGTYVATDITKFQLWHHTSNDLGAASQIGSDITTTLGTGSHSFTSLSQALATGTHYFWITTDIDAAGTVGNTINSNAVATGDLTFTGGNKSGSTTAGGAQTIIAYVAPSVFISEIASKGHNGAFGDEYIEISNNGATGVDLTGWHVEYYNSSDEKEGDVTLTGTLNAGDAWVIAARSGSSLTPDFVGDFPMNSSCYVKLVDNTSTVFDEAGTSNTDEFADDVNYEFTDCSADNLPTGNWDNNGTSNGTPGVVNCISTCTPPTTQANNLVFSNITATSMDLTWTRGDGDGGVIVVIHEASAVDANPVSGNSYTADNNFSGSPDEIGTGNFVMYVGTGTTVSVTGLSASTIYHFSLFEYNTTDVCYLIPGQTGDQSTLCASPTTHASDINFSSITNSSMDVNWTSGDGSNRIVVAKEGSPVDWSPTDFVTYTANSSFGTGTEFGTGNYVIYNGSSNTVNVTNLTAGTTYYFKIFEYNCTTGAEDYFTEGTPEEGLETTIPEDIADLVINCSTTSSMEINWTLPSGNYDAILITVDQGETPSDPTCDGSTLINPLTDYSSADIYCSNVNNSVYVFNNVGTSVSITGLTDGLSYTIKAFVYADSKWSNGVEITQTAEVSDVTNLQVSCGNTTSQVGWNNPNIACFDEVIIVANDASITANPSGDGSSYTANSVYGSGTDIGTNEFVVYKGTGELVDITNLTNFTTYYFKAFVRSGTDWSAGIEVSCMPSTAVQLNYGDMAIVGINTDLDDSLFGGDGDEVQFVAFVDITTATPIDFTDNGYERLTAGLWADSEGTLRFTRTGADLPAGSIVTIQGKSSTATPALGTDYNVYVCGVLDNANWSVASLNSNGPFDLNVNDQIWMMQGGTWDNDGSTGDHDATYSGNVLYGWTATGWKAAPEYDDTKGSTIYPGCECATTDVASTANEDKVRYTGPTGITSQIGWIGRFNDPGNWTGYADNALYAAGGSLPCVIDIDYDAVTNAKWTGVTNTDWDNCANWNILRVPDASTDVEFENDGCVNDIVIQPGETAICRDFTVNNDGGAVAHYINLEGDATKVLDIRGDLIINAEGFDLDDADAGTTDGTIKLYGNWNNTIGTDGFIEGNGTVEFLGTSEQTISTTDAFETFANVNFSNSSATGVLLNSDIQTSDNLLLNSGLVNLNGNDLTINGQYSRISGLFAGNAGSTINVLNSGSLAPFNFAAPQELSTFYMNRAGETAALATNLTMSDLNIDAGTVQLNAGKFFTVNSTITNNVGASGLLIKSSGSGTASLIHYTENVQATAERYITGGNWGYILPPLNGVPESSFGAGNPNFYYYNEATADYWDALNIYEPIGWTDVPGGALSIDRGYIVYHPSTQTYIQTGGNLYFDATNNNKVFTASYTNVGSGPVGTNGVTADWDDFEGWNLFGNPYTSAIDWDQVSLSNVEDVVYYYDGANSNYKYYGTGTSFNQGITANGGSQFVPANQGFFVKATVNNGTVTIPDAARTHNSQQFWKNGGSPNNDHLDIVRLKIDLNEYSDETVVKLNSMATDYHDNFDGYKMFSPVKSVPQIYTIDSLSSVYSINYSNYEDVKIIPVGIFIQDAGTYTINASKVNMKEHHVYLKDNEENSLTNLQNTPDYTFNYEGSVNDERFELWFNINRAPYNVQPLQNQTIYTEEILSYSLPNAFTDPDIGDYLTITVSLADGSALPEWLEYNNGTFTGTTDTPQEITVKVTATDKFGASTYQTFVVTVLETINIEDIVKHSINVYPNPATNIVNIEIPNIFSDVEISIIDASGKIVYKTYSGKNQNSIDVSDFSRGIYILEVKDDINLERQKLIIK